MKILAIRFSSIGDIVLTTPVVRTLRQRYPDAEIHFLVKEKFRAVVEHNPYLDKIHLFEPGRRVVNVLKSENFDFVVDLQKNIRSRRLARRLDVPRFSFPKLNFLKWVYVRFKLNLLPDRSVVDRYFEAVRALRVENDGKGLDFFIPSGGGVKEEDLPMSHSAGFVACVIGGSFFTKRYPLDKWKSLCRSCPYPVVLVGGPEDAQAGEQIKEVDSFKVYNAAGKFNLMESADIIQRARMVVTNDTGMMHIAAAFQKPILSLWGNTTPSMGMYPYFGEVGQQSQHPKSKIFEVSPLSCRPCSKVGYSKCPKGHFKCMNEIDEREILRTLTVFWEKRPNNYF